MYEYDDSNDQAATYAVRAQRHYVAEAVTLIIDNDETWHTDVLALAVTESADHFHADGSALYDDHEIAEVIGASIRDYVVRKVDDRFGAHNLTQPVRLLLMQLLDPNDAAQWREIGESYVEHVKHTAKVAAEDNAACAECGEVIGDEKCPNDKTRHVGCCGESHGAPLPPCGHIMCAGRERCVFAEQYARRG